MGESVVDPAAHYSANTVGTFTLLEAMRAQGVPSLIFSSTAAVYGEPQVAPIPEDHPLLPINPYGRSKLAVEGMLADYAGAYGLRYAALRYFNAAGADPEGELGERHEPETHLIPLAIRGALDPGYRFTVNGTDYPTRDVLRWTPERSAIATIVGDAWRRHRKLFRWPTGAAIGERS